MKDKLFTVTLQYIAQDDSPLEAIHDVLEPLFVELDTTCTMNVQVQTGAALNPKVQPTPPDENKVAEDPTEEVDSTEE